MTEHESGGSAVAGGKAADDDGQMAAPHLIEALHDILRDAEAALLVVTSGAVHSGNGLVKVAMAVDRIERTARAAITGEAAPQGAGDRTRGRR